ncbi:peptidoglycan-binding domain-containing protein [Ottowia sp.]|uniref:peptidoglycan-binding domain-containing protein n=1 Tax=Ottowia sp. TaxID=1898956 RepID=UPI002B8E0F3A|nr:peptidoglycan-binding domain-containing protein [Ottowia sp.]HOB66696.1 peptidoglycan-binding domain-containing protein [Ottowia sp.]HPZ55704.1 peptidoglycan-binding domain-containing protein [Ottowia sp.]HQD46321.1 peptidoglycan-binding domain-containing protein [Ottowia sp.]
MKFQHAAPLLAAAWLAACSTPEPARPAAPAQPAAIVLPAPSQPVAAPPPAAPRAPLPPMQVRTMRDVQQRLQDLGYDPGAVDGVGGARTQSALAAFQKDRGLRPTGRMDSVTREALGK